MHGNWNEDWSGWSWTLMTIGMLAFWGLVIWAIVALVRASNRSKHSDSGAAEQTLDERLAAGEIDADEYHHRLDVLRSSKVPASK